MYESVEDRDDIFVSYQPKPVELSPPEAPVAAHVAKSLTEDQADTEQAGMCFLPIRLTT